MKTTMDINDHLLIEAKKFAADRRRPLRAVMEDALRLFLAENRKPRGARKVNLPVCNSGPPRPGIDLNDTSRLLDIE